MLDHIDRKLLIHIQRHGDATNAELSEKIGISISQAGRRKARLEAEGMVVHYQAKLNPAKIGLTIQAFIQIALRTHSRHNAETLHRYLDTQPEIINIWSMTGKADYLLQVYCQSLEALNTLIHDTLLAHENIAHVESQIVMNHLKRDGALPVSAK